MNEDKITDEILKEWITKARPLVDSAWNLAIDNAIRVVENERSIEVPSGISYAILSNVVNELKKIKTKE